MAAEGVIGLWVAPDAKTGAMVEVNCETDFVARNDDFKAFAQEDRADRRARQPCRRRGARREQARLDGDTVEARAPALVQKIGENMSIRRFVRTRRRRARSRPTCTADAKIGVLVDVSSGDAAVGKDVAMHIAAAPRRARSVRSGSRNDVPAELIEKERAIFTAQAAESGKPADIVAKMVEGRVNKFLSEVTLLGQPFVKNPDEHGREAPEGEGRDGERLHAVRRRRGHREEEGRFRGRSRHGDG